MEKADIEAIIDAAAQAPSGDNAQPWRFEVTSDHVFLYNIPGRDDSPYNFKERGSFFAHGAAIANMEITASSLGYATRVSLFPLDKKECVAELSFTKEGMARAHPLRDAIHRRATNRKPYKKIPLTREHRDTIERFVMDHGIRLIVMHDRQRILALSKILAVSDQLIFEDDAIHTAIFHALRWTPEQEAERKGLYVKTLELPPPARAMFSLLKNKNILKFMNRFGISKFIGKQSAANYASASAMGAIVIPEATDQNFIEAGRWFERLWLTATARGVAIQPTTALVYLKDRVVAGESRSMMQHHQRMVIEAEHNIRAAFGNPPGTIAMVFRMGYAKPPTARSKKSIPSVIYHG